MVVAALGTTPSGMGHTNLPHLLDAAFAIFGSQPSSLLDHGGFS
jgi:hypothetical protein